MVISTQDNKISKSQMMIEIREELIIYFRNGYINPTSSFELDDVKFHNIYAILNLHFILYEEVRNYVFNLEKNIRTIKNSTILEKNLFNGEIRGGIDWDKTIQHRHNQPGSEKMNFICDNVDKFFETKENIILKKAISIIYNIMHFKIDIKNIKKQEWYRNGDELARIISNVYKSNIYIKKMETSKINITNKMIFDVSKSRNQIYRDSANIVKLYREIMSLDKNHMEKLFSETYIEMKSEDEVFELYCIIKYINKKFKNESVKYNIIDSSEEYLASLENENYLYKIYHDRTATKYLNFSVDKSEVRQSDNDYLNKKLKSLDRKDEILLQLEKSTTSSKFWSGRPDLIIIKINKNYESIEEIEIGEIKYTNSMSYLSTGLGELLEYTHLIKEANSYVDAEKIRGILFVDDIALDKYEFEDIEIINREKLNEI